MTTALHHFLSSKHTSIHPDWVTQCRDFLLSTSPPLSPSQLQDQIWTQFLHSNLREIGIEALKNQIWDLEVKNARTGWVIVQVEQVYDVGQSSFGLLDELENLKNGPAGNANGDVNSTGRQYQDQRGDKKKISRGMLKLKLTDGFHDIWGMEYKPIPELNLLMPRGMKILLKNASISRGVVFLERNSIEILGGQVDELNMEVEELLINELRIQLNMTNDRTKLRSGTNQNQQQQMASGITVSANTRSQPPSRPIQPTSFNQDRNVNHTTEATRHQAGNFGVNSNISQEFDEMDDFDRLLMEEINEEQKTAVDPQFGFEEFPDDDIIDFDVPDIQIQESISNQNGQSTFDGLRKTSTFMEKAHNSARVAGPLFDPVADVRRNASLDPFSNAPFPTRSSNPAHPNTNPHSDQLQYQRNSGSETAQSRIPAPPVYDDTFDFDDDTIDYDDINLDNINALNNSNYSHSSEDRSSKNLSRPSNEIHSRSNGVQDRENEPERDSEIMIIGNTVKPVIRSPDLKLHQNEIIIIDSDSEPESRSKIPTIPSFSPSQIPSSSTAGSKNPADPFVIPETPETLSNRRLPNDSVSELNKSSSNFIVPQKRSLPVINQSSSKSSFESISATFQPRVSGDFATGSSANNNDLHSVRQRQNNTVKRPQDPLLTFSDLFRLLSNKLKKSANGSYTFDNSEPSNKMTKIWIQIRSQTKNIGLRKDHDTGEAYVTIRCTDNEGEWWDVIVDDDWLETILGVTGLKFGTEFTAKTALGKKCYQKLSRFIKNLNHYVLLNIAPCYSSSAPSSSNSSSSNPFSNQHSGTIPYTITREWKDPASGRKLPRVLDIKSIDVWNKMYG